MDIKTRVAIGLSGGLDSSFAAWKLLDWGYDVSAITMVQGSSCMNELENAIAMADYLNIPHYVFNVEDEFRKEVILPFVKAYRKGLTPNPCILCNREIKFGLLWEYCQKRGFDKIATGHYVRLLEKNGIIYIREGVDRKKDQSYFLSLLEKKQRHNIMFPLGDMTKENVKAKAKEIGLPVKAKKESQEICFIKTDYKEFLEKDYSFSTREGEIVDERGEIVGFHEGFWKYTVGQRRGLGVSAPYPLYVTRIDGDENQVVVGPKETLYRKQFEFHLPVFSQDKDLLVGNEFRFKIRYRSEGIEGIFVRFDSTKGKGMVVLRENAYAVTPGQIMAAYDGDVLVFGGEIC